MPAELSTPQAYALRLAFHSRPHGAKLRMSVTKATVDSLVARGLVEESTKPDGLAWVITAAGIAMIAVIGEAGARP